MLKFGKYVLLLSLVPTQQIDYLLSLLPQLRIGSPYFAQNFWHVKIESDTTTGLTKASAIDALQLRGVDLLRFIRRLGSVSEVTMSEVTVAILTVVEYDV